MKARLLTFVVVASLILLARARAASFLPSSVDVSECRPANPPAEEHLASSAVVKPPAGFTDSPVRNAPPEFSLAEAEEQLCPQSQSEVLVLDESLDEGL